MNLSTLAFPLIAAVSLLAFRAPVVTSARPADAELYPAPAEQVHTRDGGHSHGALRGDHGFTYSGTVLGVGPVASSGRIDFDGRGRVSATFTTVVNGNVFEGSFAGTYVVDAEGLGSITIHLPWLGREAHGDFVVVDQGHGTFFTCTDSGYSVTGTTRKT